jgi:hypothetical protein
LEKPKEAYTAESPLKKSTSEFPEAPNTVKRIPEYMPEAFPRVPEEKNKTSPQTAGLGFKIDPLSVIVQCRHDKILASYPIQSSNLASLFPVK